MSAFYNEIDPYAAAWLRNLIAAGHIAPGVVDERSIEDIEPAELAQYTQCHFFAGIGAWSHALRLAGWPDDRPVWTGSCPCQPFSSAGKGAGFADERHLWPAFHWLISQCRPPIVFGEQVASKDGLAWLDLVQADLEGSDYAVGASDLCAAGVGAPHIRQRLYWVADHHQNGRSGSGTPRLHERRSGEGCEEPPPGNTDGPLGYDLDGCRKDGGLDNNNKGLEGHGGRHQAPSGHGSGPARSVAEAGESGRLVDEGRPRSTHGHWRDADWLHCRDGKWRPVEPGTFPLAHGAPARVGRLRAYGNAIVPQVAQTFIETVTSPSSVPHPMPDRTR